MRAAHTTWRQLVLAASLAAGCAAPPPPPPGEPLLRAGDEIVVCGQLFHIGTPVVLWCDPGGYDAYRLEPRFAAEPEDGDERRLPRRRYHSFRGGLPDELAARVRAQGWALDDLRRVVDQLVLHYDAAGTSRNCFRVLHDQRFLSVHFLLDVDGTIYQTLDLKERAWHATKANDRSIGIEIAHPGAYAAAHKERLARWYAEDQHGALLVLPEALRDGVRHPERAVRPARPDVVRGVVQGQELLQYDFTDAQYRALAHLCAALVRVFPKLPMRFPVDPGGEVVLPRVLDDEAFTAFTGVLGHFHVQTNKVDPGPAFDWQRLEQDVRGLLSSPR